MPASSPKSSSQLLFGSVLILLATLGLILLFKDMSRRSLGNSRVDWPAPAPAKP